MFLIALQCTSHLCQSRSARMQKAVSHEHLFLQHNVFCRYQAILLFCISKDFIHEKSTFFLGRKYHFFKDIVPFHLLPTVNTKVLAIILQYISPKTQQNKNDCTNQQPVATLPRHNSVLPKTSSLAKDVDQQTSAPRPTTMWLQHVSNNCGCHTLETCHK